MTEPKNKLEEAEYLIKSLNPERTLFYFDGLYHIVKNDWLTEIPAAEAEQCLKSPQWDLWNLGNPAEALPENCPSFMYKVIDVIGPVGQFLQMVFDTYNKQYIMDRISTN